MEDAPENPLPDAPTLTPVRPAPGRGRIWKRLRQWTSELLIVFVGVYAAFTLNGYQSHRQEHQRREQILDWAEKAYSEMLAAMSAEDAVTRQQGEDFERRMAAGETPRLYAFDFRSDYDPADFTSLLQSGGFDLLEVKTVRVLRAVEGTLRQAVEVIRHDQRLCDALILPNLDQDPSFFYDATRKLRPAYAWYGRYFATELEFHRQLHEEILEVLTQLRVERARNR